MATGSPPDVAGLVVELAASRAPTLGAGRLICIDGPAGSGKTTLAAAIAERTGAAVVNTDELMEGWGGFDTVTTQLTALVAALADGWTGDYHRYLWGQGRFDDALTYVAPGPWLVVEGVGSAEPAIATHITVLVWVEVDDDLRLARGLHRDGAHLEPEWREFMPAEREIFARDRTFERADVLVDGTGARPPVVRS
ncbi:uridine kinase family protein [Nocardioides dilutus]